MLTLEKITDRLNFPLVGNLKKKKGKPIFVTVSPNPKAKHSITRTVNGKRMTGKVQYGTLPQSQQFEYCLRVVQNNYNYSDDTFIFGSWELNKEGNVHFHFIFIDPNINTDVDLMIFQRDIYNCVETARNFSKASKNGKQTDWMNNIVYITKPFQEVYDYIIKDVDKCLHIYPYYKLHKKSVCLSEASMSIK